MSFINQFKDLKIVIVFRTYKNGDFMLTVMDVNAKTSYVKYLKLLTVFDLSKLLNKAHL